MRRWDRPPSRDARRPRLVAALIAMAFMTNAVLAQSPVEQDEGMRIERIDVRILNPSSDPSLNARVTDLVRRSLQLFPSDRFSRATAEFGLARARRQGPIADSVLSLEPGMTGGIAVVVDVTLAEAVRTEARGALLSGELSDFPVLYDRAGSYLKARLESVSMYYGNADAWYGQPEVFLNGNPLVSGDTPGSGYEQWGEGFVHVGGYGITALNDSLNVYAGASAIASGSVGQELFTDDTRGHIGIEDAYLGIVGGRRTPTGHRLVFNFSAGRQRFSIADGLLIANTAANGGERAALQSNPRWAADFLGLAQLRYDNTKVELFYLDPDELPPLDSETKLVGLNLESRVNRFELGATVLTVPESTFGYFTATERLSRRRLQVYDARFRWQPDSAGPGPFLGMEAALQRNADFPMRAYALTGELGYVFARSRWTPTISYRYAVFSGDDPSTDRFERWDPLFSGGNGEQWVQGINHFKLFQDSNLVTHRLQARLKPTPMSEIVPQLWRFRAESTTNLGGNPALSFLRGADLATEANVTFKWFVSRQVMLQGHVAVTFPTDVVERTVGVNLDPWFSAMGFVRIAF